MQDNSLHWKFKYFNDRIHKLIHWAKNITFFGFDGMPLYDVGLFFFRGMKGGALSTRASSVAFNFFLAMFPTIIFFFTLIPYIPVKDFQVELLGLLKEIMPYNAFEAIKDTLEDIITQQRGGLLSIGFLAALFFSTNGINSMIMAFNASYHTFESRPWYIQRLVCLMLVLILSFLTILAIALIIFSEIVLNFLVEKQILQMDITFYLLLAGKWIIIIALFFFIFSFLYYLAPAKKTKWRFISAGGSLATLLSILTSLGFSFYINHFGRYNKLYGSLGTLIVVLLWIYFNSLILMIGFELNASISQAHEEKFDDLVI